MLKKSLAMGLVAMLLVMALAACGGTADNGGGNGSGNGNGGGEPATGAALRVTGSVDNEMAWSEDEVHAMNAIDVESTNRDGETATYTGILIMDLLNQAGIKAGATTLTFVGDDGYTADVALSDIQACPDCIISFRNQGGFSTVLPGFPGNVQVKGVIEIQVK